MQFKSTVSGFNRQVVLSAAQSSSFIARPVALGSNQRNRRDLLTAVLGFRVGGFSGCSVYGGLESQAPHCER